MVECKPCFKLEDWTTKSCANVAFCQANEPDDCGCYECVGVNCTNCLYWDMYEVARR